MFNAHRQARGRNIAAVGMNKVGDDDQTLARAAQKETGVKESGLKTSPSCQGWQSGDRATASDDNAEIGWNIPPSYSATPATSPHDDTIGPAALPWPPPRTKGTTAVAPPRS